MNRFASRWLLPVTLPALLTAGLGRADSLVKCEYFFDADPGVGNGTELLLPGGAATDSVLSIPTAGLAPGWHSLVIRAMDDGEAASAWSLTESRRFHIQAASVPRATGELAAAEYFFDADPGLGNGTPLTVAGGEVAELAPALPTTGLDPGWHSLTVRFLDTLGSWSVSEARRFYTQPMVTPRATGELAAAECFFDADPGVGKGTPLAVAGGNVAELAPALAATGLAPGWHSLTVRAQDTLGSWSISEARRFYTQPPAAPLEPTEIVALEFFLWPPAGPTIPPDPGPGNATDLPVAPADPVDMDAALSMAGEGFGPTPYALWMRALDGRGNWGFPQRAVFNIYEVVTWTGAVSRLWEVGGNWDRGTPPANHEHAEIPAGTPHEPIFATVSGALRLTDLDTRGFLTVTGGDLSASGAFPVAGTVALQGGTLGAGSTIDVSGVCRLEGGTLGADGTFINQAGATLTIRGSPAAMTQAAGTANGSWVNAGNTTVTPGAGATWTVGVFTSNEGSLTVQGGVLEFQADVSSSGTLTVHANQTLAVTGATLTNSGTLEGSGTMDVQAGVFDNAGVLAPGSSPGVFHVLGDVNLTGAGSLQIELVGPTAGTQHDQVAVSGTVNVNGRLDLATRDGYEPQIGDEFAIVTYGGHAGEFAEVLPQTFATGGWMVEYQPGQAVLKAVRQSNLSLAPYDQRSTPDPARHGDTVTFALTIGNAGPSTAMDVRVVRLAPGLEPAEYSLDGGASWLPWGDFAAAGEVEVGETIALLVRARIDDSAVGEVASVFTLASAARDVETADNTAYGRTGVAESILLRRGWNCVSVGTLPANPSVAAVLHGVNEGSVWGHDARRNRRVNTLDNWHGQWVLYLASDERRIDVGGGRGDAATRQGHVLVLKPGWNLVSLGATPAVNSIAALFGDAIAGSGYVYDDGVYRLTDRLGAMYGVWVYCPHAAEVPVTIE
ncbi:MAG: hypothetical protein BWZ02_02901 [Lentisphaerae bacterium ADurb.BinA184]|nr:MAG: hypothetical protein BWZ02_02901 [Lentisphaerae bacterium ADurb.BinA184]